MKKIVSLISIFVLSLLVIVPQGLAQTNKQDKGYVFDEKITQKQSERIINAVEDSKLQKEVEQGILLQPYVDANGDFIVFDDEQALKDGVDPSLVKTVRKDYDKVNKQLSKQSSHTSILVEQTSAPSLLAKASSCGGLNKIEGNIAAGTVYIDSCKTNKIIAIIAAGGAVSGLVALLPFGAATAVVAVAIYGLGGSLIAYHNAEGNGIKVRVLRNPITKKIYPYWITSQ